MCRKKSLRELREETGCSRKEICEKYGIPYRTLQDWELGNFQPPAYVETLLRRVLEVDFLQK